ncbi:hypothetical protein BH09ACT6_BH09ACT6_15710 [soil metagenome]
MATAHELIHPGEILLEELLNPMGITQYRLAQSISVPAHRINEIARNHSRHRVAAVSCARIGLIAVAPLARMIEEMH